MKVIFSLLIGIGALGQEKPSYSVENNDLVGAYDVINEVNCIDSHSVCEFADIGRNEEGWLMIHFGGPYSLILEETMGGVVFRDQFNDKCDDPGCASVSEVYGNVEPVKVDGRWVPQIKALIRLKCGHDMRDSLYPCVEGQTFSYTVLMRPSLDR